MTNIIPTREVHTFGSVFTDFTDFENKFLSKVKEVTKYIDEDGNTQYPEWLDSRYSFYSMEYIFAILNNQYKFRYLYHEEEEFIGYFMNLFLTYTPTFFVRSSTIIEDKLSELINNDVRGAKTELDSNSKKSNSSNPYNNSVEGTDVADNFEGSLYNLSSINKNIIENAALASRAKITGEVTKYIGTFAQLFTVINITEKLVDKYPVSMITGPAGKDGKDGQDGKNGYISSQSQLNTEVMVVLASELQLLGRMGALKTSDGTDLSTTDGVISLTSYVDKYFTLGSNLLTKNEIGSSASSSSFGKGFLGKIFIAGDSKGTIEFASGSSARMLFMHNGSGQVEIGSGIWTENDGNGKIIHGKKSKTFEEIIDGYSLPARKIYSLEMISSHAFEIRDGLLRGETVSVEYDGTLGRVFTSPTYVLDSSGDSKIYGVNGEDITSKTARKIVITQLYA